MIYSTKDMTKRANRAHRLEAKQFVSLRKNNFGSVICVISSACVDLGGLTTRRAIVQYNSEKHILRIVPTLDMDRLTTLALTKYSSAGRNKCISITRFINFVGIEPELGRYLAKGTPDGVEIYLNAPPLTHFYRLV